MQQFELNTLNAELKNCYYNYKKLSYRRETARQLPTWRGLSPPVHSPLWLHLYMRTVESEIRNKRTYVKRAVRKAHFKLNRAFKVILICADRNPE